MIPGKNLGDGFADAAILWEEGQWRQSFDGR